MACESSGTCLSWTLNLFSLIELSTRQWSEANVPSTHHSEGQEWWECWVEDRYKGIQQSDLISLFSINAETHCSCIYLNWHNSTAPSLNFAYVALVITWSLVVWHTIEYLCHRGEHLSTNLSEWQGSNDTYGARLIDCVGNDYYLSIVLWRVLEQKSQQSPPWASSRTQWRVKTL